MRRVAGVLALLCLSANLGFAQTAKQGDPAKVTDATAFHSPMILETIFAAADRSLWHNGKEFTLPEWWELGKFTCDGVSLRMDSDRRKKWDSGINMKVRDLPGGSVEVKMKVGVLNPKHNSDKMVTLLLEVVNGDEVVAAQSVKIPAKDDGGGHQENVKFTIPGSSLRLDPITKLRITMTTQKY